jgi:hypothetical protein
MPESNEQVPGLGGFRVEVSTVRQRLNQRAEANRMAASDRQQREQPDRRPVRVLGREAGSGLVRVQLADGSVRLISEAAAQKAGLLRPAPPPADTRTATRVPVRAKRPQNASFGVTDPGGERLCFLYVRFNGYTAELWQNDALANEWRMLGELGQLQQYTQDGSQGWVQLRWLFAQTPEDPNGLVAYSYASQDEDSVYSACLSASDEWLVGSFPLDDPSQLNPQRCPPRFWVRLALPGTSVGWHPNSATMWLGAAQNLMVIPWIGERGRGVDLFRYRVNSNPDTGEGVNSSAFGYSWEDSEFPDLCYAETVTREVWVESGTEDTQVPTPLPMDGDPSLYGKGPESDKYKANYFNGLVTVLGAYKFTVTSTTYTPCSKTSTSTRTERIYPNVGLTQTKAREFDRFDTTLNIRKIFTPKPDTPGGVFTTLGSWAELAYYAGTAVGGRWPSTFPSDVPAEDELTSWRFGVPYVSNTSAERYERNRAELDAYMRSLGFTKNGSGKWTRVVGPATAPTRTVRDTNQVVLPFRNFLCPGSENETEGPRRTYVASAAPMGVSLTCYALDHTIVDLPTFTTLYEDEPDTRIVVAGDGDAVPSSRTALLADRTLPVCNHRGKVFTDKGPQGLVVFDSQGQQFAPTNVSELAEADAAAAPRRWAQGPYYRLNGADVVAGNRRKMQLKVVDDTGLPDALVTAINQRNRDDGDWYQFGRPEWEMGTFWPCASVFW